jgi:sirohydrochlorin cobaltochelatase
MGHGTEHPANDAYAKMQQVLKDKGCDDYLIGTVEAEPSLDDVREQLKALGVEKVVLHDLMVVAGDHANNDMAGDEPDSWKSILTADGYEVETILEGLGELPDIQQIYAEHAANAEIKKN